MASPPRRRITPSTSTVEKPTPTHLPDSRSPFVLDTREIGRRPGTLRVWRSTIPNPRPLGTDVVGVDVGQMLDLDLRLESVSEGVLVTGVITAPMQAECGRCLDPIADDLTVAVCELFAYPDSTTQATTEEDEIHRIVGDLLDLEPMVRDSIVLELPSTALCRPDCGGLCSDCGQRLDDLPAGHAHDQIDPRWAALANLPMSTGNTCQE